MKNWKHNVIASAVLGIAVALFSFLAEYWTSFAAEGRATSHWLNAEGSLIVGSLYFGGLLSLLALVRLFRKLS